MQSSAFYIYDNATQGKEMLKYYMISDVISINQLLTPCSQRFKDQDQDQDQI
jgi:hypothetical protein